MIATFDSAPWLPSTLDAADRAIAESGWSAEIVVVDDGSTDGTATVLDEVAVRLRTPLVRVAQENRGRFLARWAGIEASRAPLVLLLDSRVLADSGALRHARAVQGRESGPVAWNAHVDTDSAAPLVGRFWDVPTWTFWSGYLADPRPTAITAESFDRLPTGTTMFLAPRDALRTAMERAWPSGDAHLASDDTAVLRHLIGLVPTRIDPGFRAVYRPRVSVPAFLRHARARGVMFVDSYAGTGALRNIVLVALVALPPLAVAAVAAAAVVGAWFVVFVVLLLAVLALLAPAGFALARRCPPRAVLAYLTYVLPFGAFFWAGLARGLVVHRRAFGRARQTERHEVAR